MNVDADYNMNIMTPGRGYGNLGDDQSATDAVSAAQAGLLSLDGLTGKIAPGRFNHIFFEPFSTEAENESIEMHVFGIRGVYVDGQTRTLWRRLLASVTLTMGATTGLATGYPSDSYRWADTIVVDVDNTLTGVEVVSPGSDAYAWFSMDYQGSPELQIVFKNANADKLSNALWTVI
ncbi:hypothetical protein GF374_03645 [Candidatus Woesearchaeota archaeon]|nr:hypothetical protein [Candidatus Woesearchaeota archaeon]